MTDTDLEPNPFRTQLPPRPSLPGFLFLIATAVFAMPGLFIWRGLVRFFGGHTKSSMVPGVEDIIWTWIVINYWYESWASAMLAVGYVMYILLGLFVFGVL